MTCFDILNIEYNEEGYLLDFDLPDTMRICVKDGDYLKYVSHTEEAIRKQINNMEELYANDVKVVDFTAFYAGTNDPLRGNYEDYEAETFEAREKKIGSIRIVKNPNFPSGTSLQAYIKTNRAELRKVFGNPNYGGMRGLDNEWNLVVGPHRVTIYDVREENKRGTKYFNIGGSSRYGALLVAQALSIHRNERVHAKETVPQWLEDERQHQQVKSIDEHPDLTYERVKEYEDIMRRYRAEDSLKFKEWAKQEMKTHGDDEDFDDWLYDEMGSHGDDVTLQDWGHHELDSHYERYGAEECEYCEGTETELTEIREDTSSGPIVKICDHCLDIAMYGAEELKRDSCCCGATKSKPCACMIQGVMECNATCPCSLEKKGAEEGEDCPSCANACKHDDADRIKVESIYDYEVQSPSNMVIQVTCLDCGESGTFYADDVDWHGEEAKLRYSPQITVNMMNPTYGDLRCSRCHERFQMAAENWGGDPTGKLATALRNARIKAKEPKKPLKIEKLDAETSGQWEIGEQLEEAQMNAEGKWFVDSEGDITIGMPCGYCDKKMSDEWWEELEKSDDWYVEDAKRGYAIRTLYAPCPNCEKELHIYDEGDWREDWSQGFYAEPYAGRTPEQQAILDERKRKLDYRLALGAKYPRKCSFCLVGIHKGLEDGSLTQEEFDTYMNDPMFPTEGGCERHDYWIAEDEKEECPSCLEVTFLDGDVCDDCTYCEYCEEYHPDEITQICYENAYHKHYDGPDTDHEDYREAEDKKRKKISGVLSDPFDEVSLDSGGIKKLVVGVSIAALAYLGYTKLK